MPAAVLAWRALREDELPRLQAFLEANPEYFLTTGGRGPRPDEARQEFDEPVPPQAGHTERYFLGLYDDEGAAAAADADAPIRGFAIVVSDLFAPRVWHIALFIVATALHGTGTASATLRAMEAWMAREGARFVRLGVVVGNARAEAFWRREGYVEVRQRSGYEMGDRVNDVRVCVKPLGEEGLEAFLARVPRDAPGSALP